jgi:hypothetical protein
LRVEFIRLRGNKFTEIQKVGDTLAMGEADLLLANTVDEVGHVVGDSLQATSTFLMAGTGDARTKFIPGQHGKQPIMT